ncbi:hypothetical protein ACOSP7_016793 [Xanthoceras sorbifolium]
MFGSSAQRSRKDRGAEASASGHQGVILPQRGALGVIVLNQVDNHDNPGEVELTFSSYGQFLTLYLSFRRNGLPPPSDNVIKYCFTLRQCPLPKDLLEDALYDGMYHLRWSGPTVVIGPAVFLSSSRGLGVVAKEYLDRAPMLYEEFLIGDLSQRIEENEGPDLRHTLGFHALLICWLVPSLKFLKLCLAFSGVDVVSWRAEELLVLVDESLSILRQVGRDSTLSINISSAGLRARQLSGRRLLPMSTTLGLSPRVCLLTLLVRDLVGC